jgi:LPXTG-motif cell wall-anchored protein
LYVGNYNSRVIAVFDTAVPVTAVSPNSGATAGGTAITLTGARFTFATPTVTVGGHLATQVTVVNDTTLTAVVPAGTAGAADVSVTIPGFAPGTLTSAFTYVAPELAATGVDAGAPGISALALLLGGLVLLVARRRVWVR